MTATTTEVRQVLNVLTVRYAMRWQPDLKSRNGPPSGTERAHLTRVTPACTFTPAAVT